MPICARKLYFVFCSPAYGAVPARTSWRWRDRYWGRNQLPPDRWCVFLSESNCHVHLWLSCRRRKLSKTEDNIQFLLRCFLLGNISIASSYSPFLILFAVNRAVEMVEPAQFLIFSENSRLYGVYFCVSRFDMGMGFHSCKSSGYPGRFPALTCQPKPRSRPVW